jgi:rubrerythrin
VHGIVVCGLVFKTNLYFMVFEVSMNIESSEKEKNMNRCEITEDTIYQCFAAASSGKTQGETATSFVDVEEYENQVMYPEFSRWARKAGYPKIAELFLKVAGEEKLHATWLRKLYQDMGTPSRGEDTQRAIDALTTIQKNSDKLLAQDPKTVIEKALKVAIRVEEREYKDIYPSFRDQALQAGNREAADVYQRVIDSEEQHAQWFHAALKNLQTNAVAA